MIVVLIAAGGIVAQRANKLPAALAFLAVYVVLFTLTARVGSAAPVGDIFRPPFVNMAVFFAFIMVTDPPTSPVPLSAQMCFGRAAAAVSFIAHQATHGLYFLLVGVLVANAGYAGWQFVGHVRTRGSVPRSHRPVYASALGRAAGAGVSVAGAVLVLLLAGGLRCPTMISVAPTGVFQERQRRDKR